MTGPYVSIGGGHQLFVRDWGTGETALLLAGWGMDSCVWGETMVHLNAAGVRTVAYDRRGHGRSTDPGGVDYDLLADDLAQVTEALDLRKVTLVAHSGAAGEAIRYVGRHGRARLARIMLVGATGPRMLELAENDGGFPAAAVEAVIKQLSCDLSGWIDANAAPFAPDATPTTIAWLRDMVQRTSRKAIVDFQREIATADLTAELAKIDLPVTIIHGDRDVSAPIDLTARRYAEILSDAELIVYRDAAHGLMITHAARLASDIASRLLRTGARDQRAPSAPGSVVRADAGPHQARGGTP